MKEVIWLIVIVVIAIIKLSNGEKKTSNKGTNTSNQWNMRNGNNTINKSVTQAQQRVNSTIQRTIQAYVPKDIARDVKRTVSEFGEQKAYKNNTQRYQNPYENAGKNTQKTKEFGESAIGRKVVKQQLEQEEKAREEAKSVVEVNITDLNIIHISNEYLFPQVKIEGNLKEIETILICGYPMDTFMVDTDTSSNYSLSMG